MRSSFWGNQESLLRIKPWAFVRTGFVFEAKYHSGKLKCKLLATCTRPPTHALDSPNVIENTGGESLLVFICIHAARLGEAGGAQTV